MSIKALLTAALVAVASVSAQNATTNSSSSGNATQYATGLLQALQSANLTTLAGLAAQNAQALLPLLATGNKTVFAPTNEAFAALGDAASNATLVADILQYHIYYGHLGGANASRTNASSTNSSHAGSHTILRSLLNATEFVQLPGNQPQVGVFTTGSGSSSNSSTNSTSSSNSTAVTWIGATQNVTSVATTTYQNLVVHVIPQVLTIPQTLSQTATAANLTQLVGALQSYAPGAVGQLEATRGITVFAPVNAAFANVTSLLGTLNATQITDVLLNHVINGTVVYSTQITPNTTATSAAGAQFSFVSNANGTYVRSGNSTAQIIRADIPIANGVVHLIGSVLANVQANPQAAASAASAASSVAATATAQPTGAIAASTASGSGGAAATGSGAPRSGAGKAGISAGAGILALGVGLLVGA
ncbi:hypothetical protein JCM10908_006229 [Rhodotorula pacifica]|uniref:uncharacterized protein n=1 Tax=Rhodotorula pacifica TaxID=1495444 RepID=UPI0031725DB4